MKTFIDVVYYIVIGVVIYGAWEFVENLFRRYRSRSVAAPDWGVRMQAAAEKHLAAVSEAYMTEELGEEVETPSPAVAPYCGCDTCLVREILAGAWPVIVEMSEFNRRHGLQVRPIAESNPVDGNRD